MKATNGKLDLAAMRKAIESRDARALEAMYDDNAVIEIIDRGHPPSHPQRLKGRAEINAYLEDVCSRDMTHHVDDALLEGNRLAYSEACEYPDGTHVFATSIAKIANDRIVSQTSVQAWDE